jgi:GT2 family glycosyltransferase
MSDEAQPRPGLITHRSSPIRRDWPSVTVVITTHNGREHVERCLSALAELDYPRDRFTTVVVDNASGDGTAAFVEDEFPTVRLIRSVQNLGFAAGSNHGFVEAGTNFVATLNNDVMVTPRWLQELVQPALADPSVGLCTGKLIFARDRLRVGLSPFRGMLNPGSGSVQAWLDGAPVTVEHVGALPSSPTGASSPNCGNEERPHPDPLPEGEEALVHRLRGGEPKIGEAWPKGSLSLWERVKVRASPVSSATKVNGTGLSQPELGLWIDPSTHPKLLRLNLESLPGTTFDASIGGVSVSTVTVADDQTLELAIPSEAVARSVIQNAGTIVFRDGRGRDRGAVLDGTLHYFEDDLGQYDAGQEVFAGCGAGLLIRTSVLADVGAFDERFFAYYEDVDLCWRARLRGWRVAYAPGAVARHVHRATTSRWSGRFVYYTERNRLMTLWKLAPFEHATRELARSLAVAARASAATPYRWLRNADPRGAWAAPRLAALASLAGSLPDLLADRARIQARRRVPQSEINRWFVE